MHKSLVGKYSAPVPRYTSYPTAPHFDITIGNREYSAWLTDLPGKSKISLYIHIPYCDRLCWFCACHTKHTLKYEPVAVYLEALYREIDAVAARLKPGVTVSALHFGGGSPTMLTPDDIVNLGAMLKSRFEFADDAEISVEMDPNDMDDARYDALAAIGMTRASLGVQDFDPVVQKTINRIQTFEHTRSVVEAVRARGVHSVNCDLLYGLPHQTLETLEKTVRQIISLDPDRIALFGYAHVPWMKKHQTMIPEDALPDVNMRFEQARLAAALLRDAGYEPIGIDHFAKPTDSLAIAARKGRMRRNFQGYTDDAADALIGLGASSIGEFPQGYVQNIAASGEYQRMTEEEGLAAVRGIALSEDDKLRSYVIERVMCEFRLSFADIANRFGDCAQAVVAEARQFAASNSDRLVEIEGDEFVLTERGKPFARTVAATFDAYLSNGKGRHSIAV